MLHPAYMAQSMPALNAARLDALDILQQATDLLAMCSLAMHNHHDETSRLTGEFHLAEIHVNTAWRSIQYAREAIENRN